MIFFQIYFCLPDVRDPDVPGQRDSFNQTHPVPGAAVSGSAGGGDKGD